MAEEEELLEDEEIQEELQFIPKQQPQRPSQTPRPVRPEPVERTEVRRPQKETQRPEPSIQQPVQQRRPNYPVDYKPSRPQQVSSNYFTIQLILNNNKSNHIVKYKLNNNANGE